MQDNNVRTQKVTDKIKQLALLRAEFPANLISKLPKPTRAQTDAVKADFRKGIRCSICNGWHHPDVIHLDYVGHAALTDRLLDVDPHWDWQPVAFDQYGLPAMDAVGGLWIKLTVCGVARLGYGHPDNKKGGDAIKEAIGDALRNAAMRFGAALDLWHKGDLHAHNQDDDSTVYINKTQVKEIKDQCVHHKITEVEYCKKRGIESIEKMPLELYNQINQQGKKQ